MRFSLYFSVTRIFFNIRMLVHPGCQFDSPSIQFRMSRSNRLYLVSFFILIFLSGYFLDYENRLIFINEYSNSKSFNPNRNPETARA